MGILRSDRVSGLGGANAINGSVDFTIGRNNPACLIVPSDDFALGTGDFTLECWYYRSGLGTHDDAVGNIIMMTGNTPNDQNGIWLADAQGKLEGRVHYGSGSWNLDITSSTTMSANTWYHVAMSRSGSAVKIFIDGALEASGTSSSDLTTAYSNEAYIGGQGNSFGNRGINGYVSNARISNTALYTAAFTVPSARLEKLSSTLLLCCQSPGNVLQEATGKTIVTYVDNTNNKGPSASHFAPDKGEDHGTTFADNTKFDTLSYMVPPGGTTAESNRGRGVFGSGETPSNDKVMDYVQIQSMGNAIKFGDLSAVSIAFAAVSSSTRGVFAIGVSPNITMEYITIATTSNSTDFGDQAEGHTQEASCSNNTRGLFAGGLFAPNTVYNSIEYITIATTGNDTDFGDLTRAATGVQGMSDTTRAVFGGGITGSPLAVSNIMDYVTIASTGNAADFGDMTTASRDPGALASSTRGLIGGGTTPSLTNFIDYITIQTTGNAADYGDLTAAQANPGCTSNGTRGLWATGATPTIVNSVEYTTIATLGNAADFGDLTRAVYQEDACSDSHGGIS